MKKSFSLLCLSLLSSIAAISQAGSLDNSFGTNGKATIAVGSFADNARAVAIQADGKIIVAGHSNLSTSQNDLTFSVCRLKTDGTLDETFDGDGKRVIPVGDFGGMAMAVVIQPDGKILVGGRGFYNDDEDITVVRLKPDGTDDQDFGTGGIAKAGFAQFTDERFADMALQPDGKIVVTGVSFFSGIDGFYVARFDSEGNLDPTFSGGKKIIKVNNSHWSEARSVAVQADGRIVLGGRSRNTTLTTIWNSSVVRLLSTGDPDPTFVGPSGEFTLITNQWNYCNSVLVQPDGKILIAGNERNLVTQHDYFLIMRLTTLGGIDQTFGNGGKTVENFDGAEAAQAYDMALQPDGRIVVVGDGGFSRCAAMRLTSTGALDTDFDTDGKLLVPNTPSSLSVALQSNGRIVIAAGTNVGLSSPDYVVVRLHGSACADNDNDGVTGCDGDCDDDNPNAKPGATEICDGIDNNCNGVVDEGLTTTFYRDFDGDTYGDPNNTTQACSVPPGYVTNNSDCDDTKLLYADIDGDGFGTGSPIACGVDNNTDCDDANINIHFPITYYRDADNDGFGDPNDPTTVCQLTPPAGYVSNNQDCDDTQKHYTDNDLDGYGTLPLIPCGGSLTNTDCNDGNDMINPGILFDICNDQDDDCDGLIDENGPKSTIYVDNDGDGWGVTSSAIQSCTLPPGFSDKGGDCNDIDPGIHPGAPDVCNGKDDNCNGTIDENVILTFYFDFDDDGYGVFSNQVQACTAPTGYVDQGGDCNDNDPMINPGRPETCNGKDDNCNLEIDEGVLTTFYLDNDQDGYGNGSVILLACSQPAGYVTNDDDCNDSDFNIKPGATELCNGRDDNCDGQIDEGLTIPTWYRDMDADGFGDLNSPIQACTQPQGYVGNNSDCDDTNDTIHPNATEYCNGIDEDCDGLIDNDPVLVTWYRDADGDRWGDPNQTVQACTPPAGYIREAFDCDDTDPTIHPGATEIDNNKDDDCDGDVDEDVLLTFYRDADNDGFGDPANSTQAATQPPGYVTNNTDCNDNPAAGGAAIHPNATEICNSIDDNCDGQIDEGVKLTFYRDADGDGFGNPNVTQQACTAPAGYVTNSTDCNDNPATGGAAIHPNATEICNNLDDDCDGLIDEGVKLTFYRDVDGDSFGNPNNATQACSAPAGYVSNNSDCDDGNVAVNPNTVWFLDADNDNYYTGSGVTQCTSPGIGYKFSGLLGIDCNDANATVNPGQAEVCGNNLDDNCDGQVNEGCPAPLGLSINDVTVYESQNIAVLTVSLSQAIATDLKINFKTIDGTANKKDYKNTTGTVLIPAGGLATTVTIPIISDNIVEPTEFFDVQISLPKIKGQPQTVPISDDIGRVTILDGTAPLTRISPKSIIHEKSNEEIFKVNVTPNPTSSDFILHIESNSMDPVEVRVFDVQGKLVKRLRHTSGYLRFGNDLISGIYLVEVQQKANKKTVKVIKL